MKTRCVLLVVVAASCAEDDSISVHSSEPAPELQAAPVAPEVSAVGEAARDVLCYDSSSAEEDGETVLLRMRNEEACEEEATELNYFEIERESPLTVVVEGVTGAEYCLVLYRESGYITISHQHGEVDREGDVFEWCVVQGYGLPEHMIVRSLTPSASFTLAAEE